MNLPKNLHISNALFNNVIDVVYDKASSFLSQSLHPHYTDHSITHSERVLNRIDALIGESTSLSLSDAEKLVLVCDGLLHDIGMQAHDKRMNVHTAQSHVGTTALGRPWSVFNHCESRFIAL